MTDEELMELYQLGHFSAFDELYQRYRTRIFGYLRKRGLKGESQDEVFQQVFLKMHQCRMNYSPKYKFAAWIFTITRTVMIDYFRKNKRHQMTSLEKTGELSSEVEQEKPEVALESLQPKERELIQSRYFDEQSFEEIAQSLETTPVNVRKRVSRVLAKLKQAMAGRKNES